MLAHSRSAALEGIDAYEVRVEVDIANGLPALLVVGLPGTAVQESRERVRSALENSDLPFPRRRVVINLAPADIRKEGPAFDLPIALALLLAQRALPPASLEDVICVGELALDGSLRPVRGAVSVALLARRVGARLLLPPANAAQVAAINGVRAVAADSLGEAVSYLRGLTRPPRVEVRNRPAARQGLRLGDVKGQAAAKRALEVAAAGGHNLLLTGPPGSGKSMLAQRLPELLPDLDDGRSLEATQVHSAAGLPVESLLQRPPVRMPHHTVTLGGFVGGGNAPRPGELSLAHHGVLILDEVPEFDRRVLESLRQPLEEGRIAISRSRNNLVFPASVQLLATRNPCPCGFAGDGERACTCTPGVIDRYHARLSGPLLDRIDMHVSVPRLPATDLLDPGEEPDEAAIRQRVRIAREWAIDRQGDVNARLDGRAMKVYCPLSGAAQATLTIAISRLKLSGRGFDRLLRTARTVADLAGSEEIDHDHLLEAVGYRHESAWAVA